jgi:hypothetical protein
VALLTVHTALLAYSAYVHSPTLNEPGHLVAGLSYWKFGRFDIYNVNPPLVRMVAALPVMAAGYNEDWSGFFTGPGARPEFKMGEDFVAANGERSFFLFMIARWACIPFSWLGAIVCYLWARDLYGRPAGVMACGIWCFEPNILAHASLITPDAHATALGLAACYTFWRWLKNPTWTQAALTGIVLGLTELAKTTLILFYPLWPLMWIVYRVFQQRRSVGISLREMRWAESAVPLRETNPHAEREGYTGRMTGRDWLREAGMLGLRMAIGLYVLNLGYGFEGSLTQLKDFHFVSDLFTSFVPPPTSNIQHPTSGRSDSTLHAPSSPLLSLPVPFPKNYLLGIDNQQQDFEDYGRPSYLRGFWRDHGWWYYYLYACAIKVPIGLWLLGFLALLTRMTNVYSGSRQSHVDLHLLTANNQQLTASLCDEFVLLFPAIVIFAVVSAETGFNEHMRYVLPALPFFFILISQSARSLNQPDLFSFTQLTNELRTMYNAPPAAWGLSSTTKWRGHTALLPATLVATLGSWLIASSLWIYPHSLAYFNESIGGPINGPKYLLSSNVDWGQDLLYVRDSTVENGSERIQLYLAYFGSFDPVVVGFNRSPNRVIESVDYDKDPSRKDFNVVHPLTNLNAGQYVVSVNVLYDYWLPARDGASSPQRIETKITRTLRELPSAACAGYSTRIYEVTGSRSTAAAQKTP